jgi:hypothetical protein
MSPITYDAIHGYFRYLLLPSREVDPARAESAGREPQRRGAAGAERAVGVLATVLLPPGGDLSG